MPAAHLITLLVNYNKVSNG